MEVLTLAKTRIWRNNVVDLPQEWMGPTADKPADGADYPAGTTYEDTDTGKEYKYDGAVWQPKEAGATGVTMPTGGSGKFGWLSGIYDRLSKVVLAAGNAVIGKVGLQVAGADVSAGNPVPTSITGSLANHPAHTVATVGVATGAVLAANANRKYALIINDSDSTIYLKIGADAVMNQGIRLNANGGSYEMCSANGNLALGVINGISSGANKNVIVTEGV
jgi:hypothetical protein